MLAGGQSLIPAMRFRLARPGRPGRHQLAERSGATCASAIKCWRSARSRATATSSARRGSASAAGASIHDASRVVADPVVRQMGTVVGSLCHNDPAGDWTAVALAARATVVVRGKAGTAPRPDRRVPRRQLHDGGRRRRDGARRASSRCPTIALPARTRRSSARSATTPPPRRPCRCR